MPRVKKPASTEQPQAKVQTKVPSVGKEERPAELNAKMNKYTRPSKPVSVKSIQGRKLRQKMRKANAAADRAAELAARSEVLHTEEVGYLEAEGEMERTYKFKQEELSKAVDLNTSKKIFDLDLDTFGPYSLRYSRNGRHMIIGGEKGHVATFDWQTGKLNAELQLRELVRDVTWLHNETMFAVAQRKYAYIYDHTGAEIHCLKKHVEPTRLSFLPYHFLLASVGIPGNLIYQDTSTGDVVAEHRTRLGRCTIMEQNPWNGVMHLGHNNGTVTLWSPSQGTPLVKMLCHKGPVSAMAIDRTGRHMVTAGLDGQMRVWDIRNFRSLHDYYTPRPAKCLDISQNGLISVGYGSTVTVWKEGLERKQTSPYMSHTLSGASGRSVRAEDVRFCPYEDVLGIGHSGGISSVVIPGAGEANYDSMEANPYQTAKQRQESEVHSLMEKIQPGLIQLEPNFIGRLDKPSQAVKDQEAEEDAEGKGKGKSDPRHRAKGKSSAMRKWLRKKNRNVIDDRMVHVQEALKAKKEQAKERKRAANEGVILDTGKEGALSGFYASMKKKPKVY